MFTAWTGTRLNGTGDAVRRKCAFVSAIRADGRIGLDLRDAIHAATVRTHRSVTPSDAL